MWLQTKCSPSFVTERPYSRNNAFTKGAPAWIPLIFVPLWPDANIILDLQQKDHVTAIRESEASS